METLSGHYSSCLGSRRSLSLTHPAARGLESAPPSQAGCPHAFQDPGAILLALSGTGLSSPLTQQVPGREMPLPLPDRPSCKLDLRALPSSANTPLLGPIPLSRFRSPKVTLTLGLGEEGGKAAACDHFAKGGGGGCEGTASALNTRSGLEVLLNRLAASLRGGTFLQNVLGM